VNGIQLDIQALGNGDHVKRPMNAWVVQHLT
jgi:hypothetical protein